MENTKFVDFDMFCKDCEYYNLDENSEPCNECLNTPAREFTHKPLLFSEKEGNK